MSVSWSVCDTQRWRRRNQMSDVRWDSSTSTLVNNRYMAYLNTNNYCQHQSSIVKSFHRKSNHLKLMLVEPCSPRLQSPCLSSRLRGMPSAVLPDPHSGELAALHHPTRPAIDRHAWQMLRRLWPSFLLGLVRRHVVGQVRFPRIPLSYGSEPTPAPSASR
jgi:hypothetical protein